MIILKNIILKHEISHTDPLNCNISVCHSRNEIAMKLENKNVGVLIICN